MKSGKRLYEEYLADENEDMPDIISLLSAKRLRPEPPPTSSTITISPLSEADGRVPPPPLTAPSACQAANPAVPPLTWIMESGRGEPPFQRTHQSIFGSPQVSMHFQSLLAASNYLWGSFDPRQPFFPPPPGYPTTLNYQQPYYPFPLNYSGKKCSNCGATSTPSWRRCPAGKLLLCNACGLYQKLHNRPRPFRVAEDGSIRVQRAAIREDPPRDDDEAKICANCGTNDTPLWRKVEKLLCCNACALFYKTHGFHRPSTRIDTNDSFSDAA
jgi:hypothetical protein